MHGIAGATAAALEENTVQAQRGRVDKMKWKRLFSRVGGGKPNE